MNQTTPRVTRKLSVTPTDSILGKLPPQALDLEESVLGAAMLERDAPKIIDFLTPDDFYKEEHQHIYRAIQELTLNNSPVDMRTVRAQLSKNGSLELVGGAYYLAELTSKVSSAANIEYHARIVVEQSVKRHIIRIAGALSSSAYEDTTDVFELLEKAEQNLYDINLSLRAGKDFVDGVTLGLRTLKEIAARMERKDGLSGVPSGFPSLDRITHGWQKGELIIIAARPGMGKTAFFCAMVEKLITDFKTPVGIFSLEMRAEELMSRLISISTEIDSDKLKMGKISQLEYSIMLKSKVYSKDLLIDDTAGLSILQFKSKARKMVQNHGAEMIILDYLQLMRLDTKVNNREQEVALISSTLKEVSKELGVPIIALSQLSRAVESRSDKRPLLSDLRESGSIEQDADIVGFLYRPEYYKITTLENGESSQGYAEFIISKNRNGSLDTVPLRFAARFTKFFDQYSESSPFEKDTSHPSWGKGDDQPF